MIETRRTSSSKNMPISRKPFVIYSESDTGRLNEIVEKVHSALDIDLPVWHYDYGSDKESQFDNKLATDLENADFIVLLFTSHAVDDPFFYQMYSEATNRNKTLVPLLCGITGLSSKFNIRTKVYNWDNSDNRDEALVLLHSLLGLPKKGDPVGAKITLSSDVPCKVFRGSEFLAEVGPGKGAIQLRPAGESSVRRGTSETPYIRLAKGNHLIKFVSDTGYWNVYNVSVSSNIATSFTVFNKMKILEQIDKTGCYPVVNGKADYNADLSEDKRYELSQSSSDRKKFEIIVKDYQNKYKSSIAAPPKRHSFFDKFDFDMDAGWLDVLVYIAAGALCFYPLWKFIWFIIVAVFYFALALCTIFIICFFWNPLPEAWSEFTDAFSWTLVWSIGGVAGYWGIKFVLTMLFAGTTKAIDISYNSAKKIQNNSENAKIASVINKELEEILVKHNLEVVKVGDSNIANMYTKLPITVNGVTFNMIRVEGGTFEMEAADGQENTNENNTRQVSLPPYYIGETEVTQELWKAVLVSSQSHFEGEKLPVESLSWQDCQVFINALNNMTGRNFRLPTEAEWEFAARGGNKNLRNKYSGSNKLDDVAWYDDNSGQRTHIVATKQANELGLYDMSGNVWEFCSDWYDGYRVSRGGSWYSPADECLLSIRFKEGLGDKYSNVGFRLALSL